MSATFQQSVWDDRNARVYVSAKPGSVNVTVDGAASYSADQIDVLILALRGAQEVATGCPTGVLEQPVTPRCDPVSRTCVHNG